MFNFGQQYVQLGAEGTRTPKDAANGSPAWAPAQGDVEGASARPVVAAPVAAPVASSAPGRTESGRVQLPDGWHTTRRRGHLPMVPIGMVSDTEEMRRMQLWALALFTVLNIAIFVSLLLVGLVLTGIGRILLVTVGGGGWLALLLFNMRMASRPRRVIQSFLQTKAKTKLGRRLGKGQVVVVKGAVSLLHEELLSTEFHNVPGLVLVESSLRSYFPGLRKADAWTEHVRQTRAVDFRVTDAQTGMSAVVKAFQAAETGVATPLVHISTEVPLSTAAPVATPTRGVPAGGGDGAQGGAQAAAPANLQLMVCKGYIRQGQVITVMGMLVEEQGTHELIIQPLPKPRNISKFLLYKGFLPFFFPTWVSGLLISDQRDINA